VTVTVGNLPAFDVLIPFRADPPPEGAEGPSRQEIWDFCRERWAEVPGATVLVGDEPGDPFSPGAARNRAFASGTSRWVLAYDSDVLPPSPEQLSEMFARALSGHSHGWAEAFSGTLVLGPAASAAVVAGADPSTVRVLTRQSSAQGPTLVRRSLFRKVRGYDRRFSGWGYEDTALRRLLLLAAGPSLAPLPRWDCWSLNTVRPDRGPKGLRNRELYLQEYSPLTADTVGAFIRALPGLPARDDRGTGGAPPLEADGDQGS
jgi:hypothetical protein